MTRVEWELLCDGCGRCCLQKLEDHDTGEVFYTSIACRLLDLETCRCKSYAQRTKLAPDCIVLTRGNLKNISWLPITCSYRRIADGLELERWHHLVSGDAETIHEQGISVRGKAISENHVPDENLEAYILNVKI